LRTGNLSALSEREWQSIRERRKFEKEYEEGERLKEDKLEYAGFLSALDGEQRRVAPAHRVKAIPFETWRSYTDASIADPLVRGAAATHKALISTTLKHEAEQEEAERQKAREAVAAGKADKKFVLPESAKGLRMSVERAKEFAQAQAEQFISENPDYYPTRKNFDAICSYLKPLPVQIPNAEVFKQAFLRLRELGLLEERPSPVPEPIAALVLEQTFAPTESELVDGFDLSTGEPRKYSQAEIWRMSSTDVKKAFRMWTDRDGTDRRAKFVNPYS
jgi:hypothetical protein